MKNIYLFKIISIIFLKLKKIKFTYVPLFFNK